MTYTRLEISISEIVFALSAALLVAVGCVAALVIA